jgi:hypothetical protein
VRAFLLLEWQLRAIEIDRVGRLAERMPLFMPTLLQNIVMSMVVSAMANNPLAIKLNTITTTIPYEENQSIIQEFKPEPLDDWLNQLVNKESNGKASIKILDTNGYYSYGCLQFQMRTFLEYGNKYDVFSNAEIEHLDKLIYDCDFQKRLAKLMIQDNPNNWRHWHTSVTKGGIGLPPTLKLASR